MEYRGREDGSSYRDWDLSDGALEQLQVAERALEDAFAMSVADSASEDVLSMIVGAAAEFSGDVQEIGFYAELFPGPFTADELEGFPMIDGDDRAALIASAGAIRVVDDQGFRELTLYPSEEELRAVWENLEDRAALIAGPLEDDYVAIPVLIDGEPGYAVAVFRNGIIYPDPTINPRETLEELLPAIAARMTAEGWFPNLWTATDDGRGNLEHCARVRWNLETCTISKIEYV